MHDSTIRLSTAWVRHLRLVHFERPQCLPKVSSRTSGLGICDRHPQYLRIGDQYLDCRQPPKWGPQAFRPAWLCHRRCCAVAPRAFHRLWSRLGILRQGAVLCGALCPLLAGGCRVLPVPPAGHLLPEAESGIKARQHRRLGRCVHEVTTAVFHRHKRQRKHERGAYTDRGRCSPSFSGKRFNRATLQFRDREGPTCKLHRFSPAGLVLLFRGSFPDGEHTGTGAEIILLPDFWRHAGQSHHLHL
mmetsp:Transcript_87361/g.154889  ORF Transcript_87361/g.154889 Transcript_87361/m.154889 type:complete len:245 (-) Transcript_87361:582-1316(-)